MLRTTLNFFNPYVYRFTNRLSMAAIHTIDAVSIGLKVTLPFLGVNYLIKNDEDEDTTLKGLIIIGSAIVLPRLLTRARNLLVAPVTANIQRHLTQDMHAQTFQQPYTIHINTPTGEFAQGIASNYGNVGTIISRFYCDIVPFAVESMAVTVALAVEYGLPALVVPATVFTYSAGIYILEKKYSTARAITLNVGYNSYGVLLASIGRHKAAKQFGRIETEKQRIIPLMDQSETLHKTEEMIRSRAALFGTLISYLQLGLSMTYAGYNYTHDSIQATDVFLLNYFAFNLTMSLDQLTPSLFDLSTGIVDLQKIIDFQTRASAVSDIATPQDLILNKSPSIRFRNVNFSYPAQMGKPEKQVLDNVTFEIPAGQTIALVGKTGVGKSTIIQLLQRFYAPKDDNSYILIDNYNLKDISGVSLHYNLAVVEQTSDFVRGNWFDNIKYAREEATDDQIVAAAQLAGLIPKQMSAVELRARDAGIGGHMLSGGEKQRIAIARAILKGGVVLLLDEATAALDPETEKQVQATLNLLSAGITTIIITHKLYTLSDVHNVFYLQDCRIAEQGTCKELIAKRGLFYYQLQTQLREQGNQASPEQWLASLPVALEIQQQHSLLRQNWKPYKSPTLFGTDQLNKINDVSIPEDKLETSLLLASDAKRVRSSSRSSLNH